MCGWIRPRRGRRSTPLPTWVEASIRRSEISAGRSMCSNAGVYLGDRRGILLLGPTVDQSPNFTVRIRKSAAGSRGSACTNQRSSAWPQGGWRPQGVPAQPACRLHLRVRQQPAPSNASKEGPLSGMNPQHVAHTKSTYIQPNSEYGMCHKALQPGQRWIGSS
jgi:hypothetical protein